MATRACRLRSDNKCRCAPICAVKITVGNKRKNAQADVKKTIEPKRSIVLVFSLNVTQYEQRSLI
jgi:hypothetical protein